MYAAPRPGPPPVDPREVRPRRRWFGVAAAIAAVTLAAGIVVIVVGIGRSDAGLAKLAGGQHGTVTLTAADRYRIYSTTRLDGAVPRCRFRGPGTVTAAPLVTPQWTYSEGTSWFLVGELRASAAGRYRMTCPDETGRIAVSRSGAVVDLVVAIAVGAVVGGGGLLAALVMVLVVAVRRSTHRSRLRARPFRA